MANLDKAEAGKGKGGSRFENNPDAFRGNQLPGADLTGQ